MDEQIKKTYMLRARLRRVDIELLKEISKRQGCTLSEAVRQAIKDEAAKEGLYAAYGFVTKQEA